MNKVIVTGLERAVSVVNQLTELGLTVIECRYDGMSKPTVTVEHHPYCDKLINEGAAVHYISGPIGRGLYIQGQFLMNQCRVVWQERDTSRVTRV